MTCPLRAAGSVCWNGTQSESGMRRGVVKGIIVDGQSDGQLCTGKTRLSCAKYHMQLHRETVTLCNFAHPDDDPVQSCPWFSPSRSTLPAQVRHELPAAAGNAGSIRRVPAVPPAAVRTAEARQQRLRVGVCQRRGHSGRRQAAQPRGLWRDHPGIAPESIGEGVGSSRRKTKSSATLHRFIVILCNVGGQCPGQLCPGTWSSCAK
jgi:hypothetical protein